MLDKTNIDIFVGKMISILPYDLQMHIIAEYIYKEHNLEIIAKQRKIKAKLCKEIYQMFNVFYDDSNFRLYKNKRNQFVLNNQLINKQCYICNNNQIVPVQDNNEVVLFESRYDEHGEPIKRKIKLYIVYM